MQSLYYIGGRERYEEGGGRGEEEGRRGGEGGRIMGHFGLNGCSYPGDPP